MCTTAVQPCGRKTIYDRQQKIYIYTYSSLRLKNVYNNNKMNNVIKEFNFILNYNEKNEWTNDEMRVKERNVKKRKEWTEYCLLRMAHKKIILRMEKKKKSRQTPLKANLVWLLYWGIFGLFERFQFAWKTFSHLLFGFCLLHQRQILFFLGKELNNFLNAKVETKN